MADNPEVEATPVEETPGDIEMAGVDDAEGVAEDESSALPEAEVPARTTFLDFLKSPVIELIVGTGDAQTALYAHQAFLIKSPYFASRCEQFDSSSSTTRRIELPDEDLSATGSVLEYLYSDEYFPKRLSTSKESPLEHDSSVPSPDTQGLALLRHARVYTLAEKFSLPALKSLAHSKIHRTNSTARGEIEYARYVYKETSKEDTTIRKPVAAFWATRSHVLRHEAEDEFRAMCLEFPQFGFDVLSLVLDQKEKKQGHSGDSGVGASRGVASVEIGAGERSARKRARVSQG